MPITLYPATKKNQDAQIRDVKFKVYFDWKKENFKAGVKNIGDFLKCREAFSVGQDIPIDTVTSRLTTQTQIKTSTNTDHNTNIVVAGSANIGNGNVIGTIYSKFVQNEVFTLIFIERIIDIATGDDYSIWVVHGDSTKDIGTAKSGEQFVTDFVVFTIEEGTNKFTGQDSFKIYPAVSTKRSSRTSINRTGIIRNTNHVSIGQFLINGKTYLPVFGSPDFLSWESVSFISEGNVKVEIRSYISDNDAFLDDFIEFKNDDSVNGRLPNNFLDIKVTLSSSNEEGFAKIASLNIKYKVKAHTNNIKDDSYSSEFQDLIKLNVRRSKEDSRLGYQAASCSVTLDNRESEYSPENVNGKYFRYLGMNIPTYIEYGFKEQTIKKIKAFTNSDSLNVNNKTVTMQGQDMVKKLLKKTTIKGDLGARGWKNKTVSFLIRILALDAGINDTELDIYDTFSAGTVSYASFRGKNIWKSMQELALSIVSEIYVSQSGMLTLKDVSVINNKIKSPKFGDNIEIVQILKNKGNIRKTHEINNNIYFIVSTEDALESYQLSVSNSEYRLFDSSFLRFAISVNDVSNGFPNVWGVKKKEIKRIIDDLNLYEEGLNVVIEDSGSPTIEDIAEIGHGELTNVMIYDSSAGGIPGLGNKQNLVGFLNDSNGLFGTDESLYIYRFFLNDKFGNIQYPASQEQVLVFRNETDLGISREQVVYTLPSTTINFSNEFTKNIPEEGLSLYYYNNTIKTISKLKSGINYDYVIDYDSDKVHLNDALPSDGFIVLSKEGDTGTDITFIETEEIPGKVIIEAIIPDKLSKDSLVTLGRAKNPATSKILKTFSTNIPFFMKYDSALSKDDTWRFKPGSNNSVIQIRNKDNNHFNVSTLFKLFYIPSHPMLFFNKNKILPIRKENISKFTSYREFITDNNSKISKILVTDLTNEYKYKLGKYKSTKENESNNDFGESETKGRSWSYGDTFYVNYDNTSLKFYLQNVTVDKSFSVIEYSEISGNLKVKLNTEQHPFSVGDFVYIEGTGIDSYDEKTTKILNVPDSSSIIVSLPFDLSQIYDFENISDSENTSSVHLIEKAVFPISQSGKTVNKILGIVNDHERGNFTILAEVVASGGGNREFILFRYDLVDKVTDQPLRFSLREIVDTGIVINIDNSADLDFQATDILFNESDSAIYVCGGYRKKSSKRGRLFSFKETNIIVRKTNLVGKPITRVVAQNPDTLSLYVEKNYTIFFQRIGGFLATTAQIWAWFSFNRRNQDKIKCAITQELRTIERVSGEDKEDPKRTFEIPLDFDDFQYIFFDGVEVSPVHNPIDRRFYKKFKSNEEQGRAGNLKFRDIVKASQVVIGKGRIIKKFFGVYLEDGNDDTFATDNWSNLDILNFFTNMPYKATRLQIRVKFGKITSFYQEKTHAGNSNQADYSLSTKSLPSDIVLFHDNGTEIKKIITVSANTPSDGDIRVIYPSGEVPEDGDNLVFSNRYVTIDGYRVGDANLSEENFVFSILSESEDGERISNDKYKVHYQRLLSGIDTVNASAIRGSEQTKLTIESAFDDLIKGIDIEIFKNTDDLDKDQFGGDGSVSSLVQSASISVKKTEGISEIERITESQSITTLFADDSGQMYAGVGFTGKTVIYIPENREFIIPDFKFSYDKNITQIDISRDDTRIKNKVIVKINRKEVLPIRTFDLRGRLTEILFPSRIKEWEELHRIFKTERQELLEAGDFFEADISFSEPIDNNSVSTNLRINAQFLQTYSRNSSFDPKKSMILHVFDDDIALTKIESPNHGLSSGDFIVISESQKQNGNFEVISTTDLDIFEIDTPFVHDIGRLRFFNVADKFELVITVSEGDSPQTVKLTIDSYVSGFENQAVSVGDLISINDYNSFYKIIEIINESEFIMEGDYIKDISLGNGFFTRFSPEISDIIEIKGSNPSTVKLIKSHNATLALYTHVYVYNTNRHNAVEAELISIVDNASLEVNIPSAANENSYFRKVNKAFDSSDNVLPLFTGNSSYGATLRVGTNGITPRLILTETGVANASTNADGGVFINSSNPYINEGVPDLDDAGDNSFTISESERNNIEIYVGGGLYPLTRVSDSLTDLGFANNDAEIKFETTNSVIYRVITFIDDSGHSRKKWISMAANYFLNTTYSNQGELDDDTGQADGSIGLTINDNSLFVYIETDIDDVLLSVPNRKWILITNWFYKIPNKSLLPVTAGNGDMIFIIDIDRYFRYNLQNQTWQKIEGFNEAVISFEILNNIVDDTNGTCRYVVDSNETYRWDNSDKKWETISEKFSRPISDVADLDVFKVNLNDYRFISNGNIELTQSGINKVNKLTTTLEKFIDIYYPNRIDLVRRDIDKKTTQFHNGETKDGNINTNRKLYSFDKEGKEYGVIVGGFHLNMQFPNDPTLVDTAFLRIENPTPDPANAHFDIEDTSIDPDIDNFAFHSLSVFIKKIELRGLPVVNAPMELSNIEDSDSIQKFGENSDTITNDYIQDPVFAEKISKRIIERYAGLNPIISATVMGNVEIELGDTMSIKERNSRLDGDFVTMIAVDEGLSPSGSFLSKLSLEKVKDVFTRLTPGSISSAEGGIIGLSGIFSKESLPGLKIHELIRFEKSIRFFAEEPEFITTEEYVTTELNQDGTIRGEAYHLKIRTDQNSTENPPVKLLHIDKSSAGFSPNPQIIELAKTYAVGISGGSLYGSENYSPTGYYISKLFERKEGSQGWFLIQWESDGFSQSSAEKVFFQYRTTNNVSSSRLSDWVGTFPGNLAINIAEGIEIAPSRQGDKYLQFRFIWFLSQWESVDVIIKNVQIWVF